MGQGVGFVLGVAGAFLLAGCGAASSSASAPTTCEESFRSWVAVVNSFNDPAVKLEDALAAQDRIERQAFDLCSLAEAERFNEQIQPQAILGVAHRLMDPDVRSFGDVECVDESPLLDGTRLCRELGH
jgi:hypothetical protein